MRNGREANAPRPFKLFLSRGYPTIPADQGRRLASRTS
jgi:hypothetical protein